ncbi:MAG TPA: 50S ribosomal protein L4 [Spirochaetia bacterium]|nr:50S ribosomal protein L4 [Spirochaetia bacterium]
MKTQVYGLDGKAVREIELADSVWNRDVSEGSIYHAIRNELANRRVGTAKIKDRGEVQGSGKKPWKQKGTGRARAGHKRSPVWVGGGKIFGPRPRDYSYTIPRKVKRLAMISILSLKTREERLKVVTDFTVESGKTKDLVTALRNLAAKERTVVVLKDDDAMIRRAGRNVPWLSFLSFNRLAAKDLFYCQKLLVLETAATKLNDFYGADEKNGSSRNDGGDGKKPKKGATA